MGASGSARAVLEEGEVLAPVVRGSSTDAGVPGDSDYPPMAYVLWVSTVRRQRWSWRMPDQHLATGRARVSGGLSAASGEGQGYRVGVNRPKQGTERTARSLFDSYVVPRARIELATHGFSVRCSTPELPRRMRHIPASTWWFAGVQDSPVRAGPARSPATNFPNDLRRRSGCVEAATCPTCNRMLASRAVQVAHGIRGKPFGWLSGRPRSLESSSRMWRRGANGRPHCLTGS